MSLGLLGKFDMTILGESLKSDDHISMGQSIYHGVLKDKGKSFKDENPHIEYPKQNKNIQSGFNTVKDNKLMTWQHRVH